MSLQARVILLGLSLVLSLVGSNFVWCLGILDLNSRPYALREKAMALGWTTEKIIVIDNDLGAKERHNRGDQLQFCDYI